MSLNGGGRIASNVNIGGQGNAGAVEILATDSIAIDGKASEGFPSAITSVVNGEREGEGKGIGNAGNVTVTTNHLSLTNSGRVSATTLGQGNAGNLTINAADSIFISGFSERFRSGIVVDALINQGNSGNAKISTNQLTIENGGTIEASNFDSLNVFPDGTGQPGNISIEANSMNLNNEGRIEAASQFAEGDSANIDLTVAEDIILQNNSFISARALENATGGNVTIDANDGFILAFPNQNNDIIANASEGRGGAIDINTQAIFGLEERPLNPLTNDINASSQATGLDGTVDINNPAVDPTTGLINLPASVGDASDQISQNPCQQGVGSQFIVTGKGGLPPTVSESLNSEAAQVDLVEAVPSRRRGDGVTGGQGENITTEEAVPAMGWVFNDRGEVTLTAYKTTNTEIKRSPQVKSNSCSVSSF
ncbi:MAG: S-layer family protein [Pleurocapsa sp. MO_192.B19]|nr:S-layer family protein [Pleurocapsa sp. MO_192.B19]